MYLESFKEFSLSKEEMSGIMAGCNKACSQKKKSKKYRFDFLNKIKSLVK